MTRAFSHPAFAEAHRHLGRIVELPTSGSYGYLRQIAGNSAVDVTALYPIWEIAQPEGLAADFASLRAQGAVSFVGVCSPFLPHDKSPLPALANCWRPFKTHYIHHPEKPFNYSKHHRYELKQAQRHVQIRWSSLSAVLDRWCELYEQLKRRHHLTGIHDFPRSYFTGLCDLPMLSVCCAETDDEIVAMHLWLDDGNVLWSHLAASSDIGYQNRAAYAINADVITRYGQDRLINFGGSAGVATEHEDGLARFKRGFANHLADSWLFGKILDEQQYQRLSAGLPATDYFPAYRQP